MENSQLDNATIKELNSSGNWAYFIGFYYVFIGIILLCIGIYFFANKELTIHFVESVGISNNVKQFLIDTNQWLVLFFSVISAGIVFLNGFFLIKYRSKAMTFFLTEDENRLSQAFKYLSNYLKLNSLFSLVSIIFSLVAIVYFLIF